MEKRIVERVLRRDRLVSVAGLLILTALAWLYLADGALLGMDIRQMSTFALLPYKAQEAMPAMAGMSMEPALLWTAWTPGQWILMLAMWWVMMIAMMTPSAAPAILLYASVYRVSLAKGASPGTLAPTIAFAAGYLLVWLGFSAVAVTLQWCLERAGLVSSTLMSSRSGLLSGALLIGVGAYQLTPIKDKCLAQCRQPASFLSRHWRPRTAGALRLGLLHGAYCVGCCWLLMGVLFVAGVMNMIWIVALTGVVLVEKWAPGGRGIGRGIGVALIGWGTVVLLG